MDSSLPFAKLPLDPFLAGLAREVARIAEEAEALCRELTPEQLAWRPSRNGWGVAECFTHLVQAADLFHPRFASAIDRTRAAGAIRRGAWNGSRLGRLFRTLSGARVRIPIPAPPLLRIRGPIPDAYRRFIDREQDFLGLLQRADGLDLGYSTTGSPISRRLRIPLGDGLAILAGHARRHLEQARRVTLNRDFPKRGDAGPR